MKPPLVAGESYHGVKVVRRLSPGSRPAAWRSHPKTTLVVVCKRCTHEVRAIESHVRRGTFLHDRGQCFGPVDLEDLMEELIEDGDLS